MLIRAVQESRGASWSGRDGPLNPHFQLGRRLYFIGSTAAVGLNRWLCASQSVAYTSFSLRSLCSSDQMSLIACFGLVPI